MELHVVGYNPKKALSAKESKESGPSSRTAYEKSNAVNPLPLQSFSTTRKDTTNGGDIVRQGRAYTIYKPNSNPTSPTRTIVSGKVRYGRGASTGSIPKLLQCPVNAVNEARSRARSYLNSNLDICTKGGPLSTTQNRYDGSKLFSLTSKYIGSHHPHLITTGPHLHVPSFNRYTVDERGTHSSKLDQHRGRPPRGRCPSDSSSFCRDPYSSDSDKQHPLMIEYHDNRQEQSNTLRTGNYAQTARLSVNSLLSNRSKSIWTKQSPYTTVQQPCPPTDTRDNPRDNGAAKSFIRNEPVITINVNDMPLFLPLEVESLPLVVRGRRMSNSHVSTPSTNTTSRSGASNQGQHDISQCHSFSIIDTKPSRPINIFVPDPVDEYPQQYTKHNARHSFKPRKSVSGSKRPISPTGNSRNSFCYLKLPSTGRGRVGDDRGREYLTMDNPRYATTTISQLTYGEGAQTFFASTSQIRCRNDYSSSESGSIIYSNSQLLKQKLIHMPLDFPDIVEGAVKPRYGDENTAPEILDKFLLNMIEQEEVQRPQTTGYAASGNINLDSSFSFFQSCRKSPSPNSSLRQLPSLATPELVNKATVPIMNNDLNQCCIMLDDFDEINIQVEAPEADETEEESRCLFDQNLGSETNNKTLGKLSRPGTSKGDKLKTTVQLLNTAFTIEDLYSRSDPALRASPKRDEFNRSPMSDQSVNLRQSGIQEMFNSNKQVAGTFEGVSKQTADYIAAAKSVVPSMMRRGVISDDDAGYDYKYTKKAKEVRLRVAVVVGIGVYEDRRIIPKDQCNLDAIGLAASLEKIGFTVKLLTTREMVDDGGNTLTVYPNRENILNAIKESTVKCKTDQAISLVCIFGGGYIGPILDANPNDERQQKKNATVLGLKSNAASQSAVLVPPEVSLNNINGNNTLSLSDLEKTACGVTKNCVYIDAYSVTHLPPCDPKIGGFCLIGGRKCIGSELTAFYSEKQFLLMSFYLRRGFIGYASRDSRISVNSINAYIARKLKKYNVKVETTASTFFIGDVDFARVHELRYCRYEIREIKNEQYNHFAKFHLLVIPTRNQDPLTVEFLRDIQNKFISAMKNTHNANMVCYSRLIRPYFHFFMRSAVPEKIYLNEAAIVRHESNAVLDFKKQLNDNTVTYELACHGQVLTGCLKVKNPIARRELLQKFSNSDNIRLIKRLKKEAGAELDPAVHLGKKRLSFIAAMKVSASVKLKSMPFGAGYLDSKFVNNFNIDHMVVHDVGIETLLTYVTTEYLAQKMDRIVRTGAIANNFVTKGFHIEPLTEKALHVEKIISKAQAIVRGFLTRREFRDIIPLVKKEVVIRTAISNEQKSAILELQRNNFASHCGTLESVESKQRDLWIETFTEDREMFFSEYLDSFTRCARKDKSQFIKHAIEQDRIIRHEFNYRCGFTAFAFSLMTTIKGMLRVQVKHTREYRLIIETEAQEWLLIIFKTNRMKSF